MKKVNFYIDGFNFYHPLDEYQKRKNLCLKWLDYKSLCSSFILENEQIGNIYFFTAIRKDYKQNNPSKYERHKIYIKALQAQGIIVIEGRFLKKHRKIQCQVSNCLNKENTKFDRTFDITIREEKRTDVSIACYLIKDAFLNQFDKAFIFSADTDLIPAIQIVREYFDNKKTIVGSLQTWNWENNEFIFPKIEDLRKASNSELLRIHFSKLKKHLLPESIIGLDGKLIKIPKGYLSKEKINQLEKEISLIPAQKEQVLRKYL